MNDLYNRGLGLVPTPVAIGADPQKEMSVTTLLGIGLGGMLLIYGIPALRRRRAPRPYRPDRYDPLYAYRHHY